MSVDDADLAGSFLSDQEDACTTADLLNAMRDTVAMLMQVIKLSLFVQVCGKPSMSTQNKHLSIR